MPRFRLPLLNSLRAFEAAARLQSIKRAGNELHVSHAAVTRHIQKLEAQIGQQLFERHHRHVVLTEAGKVLLASATMGFSHIQRGYLQLQGNSAPKRLVISVDPDFAGLWLVPRLDEFYARVPNTLVEIVAERAELCIEDERISCAIQYAQSGMSGANTQFLFRSQLFPVCSPELMQRAKLRSLDDLKGQVLLHDRTLDEWHDYIAGGQVTAELNLRSGIVFSDTSLSLDASVRGQGVAIGDDYLAAHFLADGLLVRPFAREMPSKNAYYLVRADHATAVATQFERWLVESIQRARRN